MYVGHLEKVCALKGVELKWRPEAAPIVFHGLSRAGDGSFPPKPALAIRRLIQKDS